MFLHDNFLKIRNNEQIILFDQNHLFRIFVKINIALYICIYICSFVNINIYLFNTDWKVFAEPFLRYSCSFATESTYISIYMIYRKS